MMSNKAVAFRAIPWALALCGWLTLANPLSAAGPLAIQGAKIYPISGDPIDSGVILIRDGKIEAVGTDVDIPGEAKVIDASGMVVMPGFIDAHNSAGMSQANEQNAVVPFLSVVDSIDPVATYFEECRRNGITTAAVVPGNSTLIGGKAAIVKTAGSFVDDMLVRRDAALKLSLRPTSGNRMSQMAQLRKELDKAKRALEKESEKESAKEDEDKEAAGDKANDSDSKDKPEQSKPKSGEDADESSDKSTDKDDDKEKEQEDQGLAAMKLAVQGRMPVYIYCERAMDVAAALRLADEYSLQYRLVLGQACHRAAKLLAEHEAPVILDPTLVFWETDERTREDRKIILPEIYGAASVPYLFQISGSGSQPTLGSSYFWYQAATAVKYGLSRDEALAAITLRPAQLLGIDQWVGSIEVGKDADLLLLTGEPLQISTWVDRTIVGGEVVYDRSQDEKVKRLLSPEAE